MAAAPEQSLPKQNPSWADLKAAYRFLSHPDIEPDEIQSAHRRQVRDACAEHPLVLIVEDGSELDYTFHPSVEGLGLIGNGKGRGLLQHSSLAVTPAGRLLGLLDQIWWKRVRTPAGETRRERESRDRESSLWSKAMERIGSLGSTTRAIYVADRGSDCYETLHTALAQGHGFLIRARHDRHVNEGVETLWSFMERQATSGMRRVSVPARPRQGKSAAQPRERRGWRFVSRR